MVNYIVDDIAALVEQLKNTGVTIVDQIEDSDYGKFVHILDAEGNKIQLWEPKDYIHFFKKRQPENIRLPFILNYF